ncbi:MAG: hypothetical protein KAU62_15175 [Candidatus Heimdallarchaeota archaeon]|nr:hypothetical protein [Candidatus Heimdallarchaeota archaeon]MCK4612496.1 hypothetical protein [Candidatus Heimdallarchaeota archaeon]
MGLWSKIKKAVKKAVKKVVKTVKKIVRVIKEVIHRLIGIFDFFGSLIGIRPKKYLRLKIFILRKDGKPIQDKATVQSKLDKTIKIFKDKLNVEIRKANLVLNFIDFLNDDAPAEALNVSACSFGAMFTDAADYFDDQCNYARTSTGSYVADLLGIGEPIFAFVVLSIGGGKFGCGYPWGPLNYCLITTDCPMTSLAHELCHMCGLTDSSSHNKNLMSSNRNQETDYDLNRWQISVVRNSRFVTYIPRRG